MATMYVTEHVIGADAQTKKQTIAEVILFCSLQEFSMREKFSNKGNYVEMLQTVAQHDDDVQKQL